MPSKFYRIGITVQRHLECLVLWYLGYHVKLSCLAFETYWPVPDWLGGAFWIMLSLWASHRVAIYMVGSHVLLAGHLGHVGATGSCFLLF